MAVLPISASSTPGHLIGEGEGRLINCYAEKLGGKSSCAACPG